jgi:hypothetical protein
MWSKRPEKSQTQALSQLSNFRPLITEVQNPVVFALTTVKPKRRDQSERMIADLRGLGHTRLLRNFWFKSSGQTLE